DVWSSQVHADVLLRRAWGDGGRLAADGGGGLRPGALANLVVYDPDHPCFWPGDDVLRTLAYADTSAAIWAMLVAGRWRGQAGDLRRSEVESAAYREALTEPGEGRRALLAQRDLRES